jgi:TonB family protein
MKTVAKVQRTLLLACVSASFVLASCAPVQPAAEGTNIQPGPSTFADALNPSGGVPCRVPSPRYTALQRQLGIRGSVRLTYVVNAVGRIDLVVVDKSSGNEELDSAARDALAQATCAPYVVDGVAHRVVQHATFNFGPKPTIGIAHLSMDPPVANPSTATAAQQDAPVNPTAAATAASSGRVTAAAASTVATPTLEQAIQAATLRRMGIAQDSTKAALIKRWGERMRNDPDVSRFLGNSPGQANVFLLSPSMRAGFFIEGMLRLSPEARTRYTELTLKALDNAPPDCGGVKDMSQVIARYMSLATMSDDDVDAYYRVTFEIFKQSALQSPLANVTEEQRVQGLQAVSKTLRDMLKSDAEETRDAAAAIVDPAGVSAEVWCENMRTYTRALFETPQPFRDWAIVAADTDARAKLASLPQTRTLEDSSAQDYATRVQRRVRPNIIWAGPTLDLETEITVHCAPTGTLLSATITRSSGNAAWDMAALRAVQHSDPLPQGADGRTPAEFAIELRPAG